MRQGQLVLTHTHGGKPVAPADPPNLLWAQQRCYEDDPRNAIAVCDGARR